MATMPWDIDRQRGVSYTTSPTSGRETSGQRDAFWRKKRQLAAGREQTYPNTVTPDGRRPLPGRADGWFTPPTRTATRTRSTSSGGSGARSYGGGRMPGYGTGAANRREVQRREAGPLPLTAEEIAAFADQRRAITRAAQQTAAEAARARAAALEAFKGGRFNLNAEAQAALRNIAGQAAGRGRGQARSSLQTYTPMSAINLQRQTGMGTLQGNLTTARAEADAAKSRAEIERDAALAKLEQQMALRRSMPRGFFTGMGG